MVFGDKAMRPIIDMDSIAVLLTNACVHSCSNCTQCVSHFSKPDYMSFGQFKQAVDSMVEFPRVFGFHGGEPLLHPEFDKFCEYALSKIPRERLGLWTGFPKGKEHYRELIVKVFGQVFLNDHTRKDILHGPILVSSQEVLLEQWQKDYLIDKCWIQNSWSASINFKGAFFCEVAAALALLLDKDLGWDVDSNWWKRSPKDYISQMELCKYCGVAMPLKKRVSCEGVDDISPKLYERLKFISPKLKRGKYVISDCQPHIDDRQMATYKDAEYRNQIASRYGIFLTINERGYNTPHLMSNYKGEEVN
jgi:hypothetical protein